MHFKFCLYASLVFFFEAIFALVPLAQIAKSEDRQACPVFMLIVTVIANGLVGSLFFIYAVVIWKAQQQETTYANINDDEEFDPFETNENENEEGL